MCHLSSKNSVHCGIIRIHEDKTCEIPLLPCSNLPVWSSKASMFNLQTNLVYPSKETRASKDPHSIRCFESGLSGKIHSSAFSQTSSWHRPCKFSPPISSNTEFFYYASKSSETASWATNSISRRTLFPFSEKTLGALFDSTQVLFWKNSYVFGPCTTSRQRKRLKMATSLWEHPSKDQNPNTRSGRRQPQRHEKDRQAPRLGPSALPFSFDPKVSSSTSQAKTGLERRPPTGRHLSIDAPNSRSSRWAFAHRFNRSTHPISSESSYDVSNSSSYKRVPSVHQLLPDLSDLPETQSAVYNQYHRIYGVHHSRFIKAKPFSFEPSITLAMGHSIDSITQEIKLQWQNHQQN